MPTTLDRTTITHTPPIQEALKVATRRWPGVANSTLISNLILIGSEKVAQDDESKYREWLENTEDLARKYSGLWGDDYLDIERSEWPQ